MVRLTDRPDMTLDVYRGRKTTMQQQQENTDTINIFESNKDANNAKNGYMTEYTSGCERMGKWRLRRKWWPVR